MQAFAYQGAAAPCYGRPGVFDHPSWVTRPLDESP